MSIFPKISWILYESVITSMLKLKLVSITYFKHIYRCLFQKLIIVVFCAFMYMHVYWRFINIRWVLIFADFVV